MNRYKVTAALFVDAETEDEANDLVDKMLGGTERMTRMWHTETVEKQWEHIQ